MAARATRSSPPSAEREWWLRTLAVFASPRSTFAALRDGSREASEARQEPVLALALLAGIAGVLAAPTAGDLLDDPERDALVVAVLVFLAGGLYGAATYWLGGGALHVGMRAADGQTTYRQARHVLAFAAAPLALSLLTLWPLRLAVYGGELFRAGGPDEASAGRWLFEGAELAFSLWAAALLVVGVKTLHGWPLMRSLGALVLAVLALVALAIAFSLA
jgi:hypothetical protein